MKVVILAGGFGTRLAEYTQSIPKPMVEVGGKPILWHIMKSYSSFGYKDFLVATGYKSELIKDYFLNYTSLNSDFTVDLSNGTLKHHQYNELDWKITLADTGLNSMTGGRVLRMKKFVGDEPFLLTYGDGLADINIGNLVKFHKEHGKMVTVSAVRPVARFGELVIENNSVTDFQEKPQVGKGWVNGGYFVIQPEFFDFIEDDSTILEREPLEKVAQNGELMAYRHHGFWQCMDTKRDRDILEDLWQSGNAPWVINKQE